MISENPFIHVPQLRLKMIILILLAVSTVGLAVNELESRRKIGGEKTVDQKHFNVIPFHLPSSLVVTRNSTDHIVRVTGPLSNVLEVLSRNLHFSYSYINDKLNRIEDRPGIKGMLSYLLEGKADIILGIIAITAERSQRMNFPHPCVMDSFIILIPMPGSTTNLAAVLQPFQQLVWILIPISAFLAIIALWLAGRAVFAVERQERGGLVNSEDKRKGFISLNQSFTFVVSMLLSQGLQINSDELIRQRKFGIRCLAFSWALAVFFLTTAYSSVLTSFITSPNYKPILESIYDLRKTPGLEISTARGLTPGILFVNAENGIGKFVGDMFKKKPELLCNEQIDCVEMVRKQKSLAYTSVPNAVLNLIGMDLKNTGRCDFTVAKQPYWTVNTGIGLSKELGYMLEDVNKNIMRMHEAGLIKMWMFNSLADPTRCLKPPEISDTPRLSLAGLSGAFAILIAGIVISICLFIGEFLF